MTSGLEHLQPAVCQDTLDTMVLLTLTSLTGTHIPANGPRCPTPAQTQPELRNMDLGPALWVFSWQDDHSCCPYPCCWSHLLYALQTHVTVLFPISCLFFSGSWTVPLGGLWSWFIIFGLSWDYLGTCTYLFPLRSEVVRLCPSKGTAGAGGTLGLWLVLSCGRVLLLPLPDTELLTYRNTV